MYSLSFCPFFFWVNISQVVMSCDQSKIKTVASNNKKLLIDTEYVINVYRVIALLSNSLRR